MSVSVPRPPAGASRGDGRRGSRAGRVPIEPVVEVELADVASWSNKQ
jgi:hypothetical protein